MEDEDVPPLEDLTDFLTRNKTRPPPRFEPRVRMRKEPAATEPEEAKKSEEKSGSFGGFSRGFLLSNSTSSAGKKPRAAKKKPEDGKASSEGGGDGKASAKEEDIPFLKPCEPQRKAPVIPEVQEAMKEAYSLMDTQEWMTDSLLEKIEKHPLLSRALRDPTLARALSKFQTDPESVLQTAAGNPQLQEVLREFCALMGGHFTELADRQDSEKHGENYVALEKDEEVEKVLGQEGVKEALSDPQIQRLFSFIREDSDKAQKVLSSANPDLKQKVQLLIDNGLLALH